MNFAKPKTRLLSFFIDLLIFIGAVVGISYLFKDSKHFTEIYYAKVNKIKLFIDKIPYLV